MAQSKDRMSEIDDHISRRFDIQKRLGKGAYGIVWKAVDRKTKEVVAIKKIFDAFRNQTDAQRTFREIMFLQSFKMHPNIVKLHSIHRAANNRDIYLGFEYMETDLHNVIKRGNILKEIHKRYIMYQLFKAIRYIHSGNVIHRDLKPSNVLLDSLCKCKIADFGLARSLHQIPDGSLGGDGDPTLTDYVATRWYRAPEILIANRKYTKGIDMWSLGCILAELLAGKPIFPGTSTVNQVEKIMVTIPTPSCEDINLVCPSGVGSSMIKNAAAAPKIPFHTLLDDTVSEDAVKLINKLLVFNPLKRLTASEALKDEYVSRFHESDHDMVMPNAVVTPLNDDIRLSVEEYRNKLYELMAKPSKAVTVKGRSPPLPDSLQSRLVKNTDKYVKSNFSKQTYISHSEPKMWSQKLSSISGGTVKSDCKVMLSKPMAVHPLPERSHINKAGGDCHKAQLKSHSEVPKRKYVAPKNNIYTAYNSYNKTHGIITQSALMELRAAGLR